MRLTEDDRHSSRWNDDPQSDEFGPQGAALILELQRLRQALDAENKEVRRPRGKSRPAAKRPAAKRPAAKPDPIRVKRTKRRRKSRMGKAIDVWLQQFGLKARPEVERRYEPAPPPPPPPPPRRASPRLAPHDPLTMDLSSLAPDIRKHMPGRSVADVHPNPPALPGRKEMSIGTLIAACRSGLTASARFVISRDDAGPPAESSLSFRTSWSFERELRTGVRILLIAGILGGGWFVFMPLASAVVVPGNLVVQSNVKTIQHPTGGVVAEIAVRNGSRVKSGDLLVRLDATQAQASLQMVSKQLDEVRAKIARLSAERDGLEQLEIPQALAARASDDTVKSLLASEQGLFKARFTARHSQKDLLQSKVAQLTEEISGLNVQVDSRSKQLELIKGELAGVQDLYDKRLVPVTRLTTLQREAARIDGERGQLLSSIAETKSKIGEAELQIVRIDQDFRTEVVKDLGEAQGKEAELVERGVAARDQLDRIEIHAPTSGLVHQLAAHTIGGVIKAGDAIMEIVPDADDLQVEARLQPQDIDHVHAGQQAFVRFSAFNQRTTPQLTGEVSYVSADTSRDQQTNATYFTVRVTLPDDERRRLAGQQLVPGMPAEVFMQTGSRTMMSYVFKPIVEQMRRAFVEQ
jgi:membrane fusion protein, type I secretion system